MMINKEKSSGIFIFLVGLYFAVYSLMYPLGYFSNMGPGMFPLILSSLLMILGTIVFLRGFSDEKFFDLNFRLPALIILIIIASAVLFKTLGAIVASTFLIVSSASLHEKFKFKDSLKLLLVSLTILLILKMFLVKMLPL